MLRAALLGLNGFVIGRLLGCKPSGSGSGNESKALPERQLREVYPKGIQVTKSAEAFRARLYNDAGQNCVIGYGHLVRNGPCDGTEPEDLRLGISELKASAFLMDDMVIARRAVSRMVQVDMTDGQYAALCDFAYNVGAAKLQKSTLLTVVNQRQLDRVPHQFRRWVMAGGRQVAGLMVRRQLEIELFFDGALIPRAAPAPDEDLSPIDVTVGE